jgi:Trm5-related predicted tRNA methylase
MHGLRMPFLYKRKSYAEKKCINEPGYQLSEFDSENDAKEIFNIKMEEYQKALNKTKMDILKSHLDKANMPLMMENSIP